MERCVSILTLAFGTTCTAQLSCTCQPHIPPRKLPRATECREKKEGTWTFAKTLFEIEPRASHLLAHYLDQERHHSLPIYMESFRTCSENKLTHFQFLFSLTSLYVDQQYHCQLHFFLLSKQRNYSLLTPRCRVLLEKLTGLQLVKKFPAFHGTRKFIIALTSVRHLSLSWASPIQPIYPHPTSWRSILILSTHLRLGKQRTKVHKSVLSHIISHQTPSFTKHKHTHTPSSDTAVSPPSKSNFFLFPSSHFPTQTTTTHQRHTPEHRHCTSHIIYIIPQ